jgi:hypothetical protein
VLILGLDIATVSGLCWMNSFKPPCDWKVFAAEAAGEFQEEKSGDLAIDLRDWITPDSDRFICRPDFAAIEMPQRSVKQFGKKVRDPQTGQMIVKETINPNSLQLSALAAGATATLDLCGVPWGLIAPATWRSAYYGKGMEPPEGEDWKDLAVTWAERQGITLPDTNKGKGDAAESIGIASAWMRCTRIAARHHKAFMALRTRDGRVAA